MNQLQRFQTELAAKGFEWALINDITNVGWLSGFTGSFALILASADKAIFVTDSRYDIQASTEVQGFDIRVFRSPVRAEGFIKDILAELGIKKFGFESSLAFGTYLTWKSQFEGVELEALGSWVSELRMIKSADEIAKIKKSCELTDACFAHFQRLIQPGVTEYEIQLEIEFFLRRNGAALSFEPIVVSGANSARPHGKATDKPLEVGDFLTTDFGGKLDGYCADMTRTVVVGPATDRHREVYDQVLKAQIASIEMIRPGVAAKDVDLKAREILDEKGFSKYFGHGLGHGLGRLVHDPGSLSSVSPHIIAEGQVWTVEPGVYIEGFGGVRIEDNVVVTADGIINLTGTPKELLSLP